VQDNLQKQKVFGKRNVRYNALVGLRESKKQRTRREIADRAMQLFAQRGFDRVTVAEVAAAADVSDKTVYNYFPTKEDLFFDEVPAREAALVAAIRERAPGESILGALRRLQARECPRLCSPGFATFARIIEGSQALQAKELEVMARFVRALTEAIQAELAVDERDARIAAGLLVSVHWQLFRTARKQALAGKHGPAAVRRLRAELERAHHLLEHGLVELERPREDLRATHTA
jgi:AcrR family transcriptional regulator